MTNRTITLIAYGSPAPQGSKSFKGMRTNKATGRSHAVLLESSKKVAPWRQDVKAAAEQLLAASGGPPIDAPIRARMVFTVPKPSNAPKTKRTYPCRMPDLSKLVRSTEDALTDAGVWRDDARVVEYSRTAKVYPGEDPEALDRPGVRIIVEALA
jgi:Holliday junction resolvase RusA-like endonuclease